MPKKCCVPGCKSNHKLGDPYINSFLFPRNEDLRRKWLTQICREDYIIKKSSVVCILHFSEDAIVKRDTMAKEGEATSQCSIPRIRLSLKPGSYPTIVTIPEDYEEKGPAKRRKTQESKEQVLKGGMGGAKMPATPPDVNLQCTSCDHVATNAKSLAHHLKSHSLTSSIFSCPYCDFESSLKSQIYPHLSTHANEKPFKCDYCSYRTEINTDIAQHTKTHTGEKSL